MRLCCGCFVLPRFGVLPSGAFALPSLHTSLPLCLRQIAAVDTDQLLHQSGLCELLLHNNRLQQLPDSLECLASLAVLDVSNNDLRDLPASLGWMEKLQHVKAEGNLIKTCVLCVLAVLFLFLVYSYPCSSSSS